MNKNDLIEGIAAKADLSKTDAARAVTVLTDIIAETLQKGDSLSLLGFGTFEVRSRGARIDRNPKTGEELKIAAAKVPVFKPGTALKEAVNDKMDHFSSSAAPVPGYY